MNKHHPLCDYLLFVTVCDEISQDFPFLCMHTASNQKY